MLTYKRKKPISGDENLSPITITYKRRKPISVDEQPTITIEVLPDDLVVEILARLPGKQIGRCKCVSKPWRSMIGSSPFRDTHRKKNSGLLLYSSSTTRVADTNHLRLFHCPLPQHDERDEQVGEFNQVGELDLSEKKAMVVTNMVQGLVCSYERKTRAFIQWLTLHNIYTGEKMRIPKPVTYARTLSNYFLGFDSAKRVYKFLRITYHFNSSLHGVEIITLRPPSGPQPTWRKIAVSDLASVQYSSLVKIYSDDGLLCWRIRSDKSGLIVFDFNTEIFRFVDLSCKYKPEMVFHVVTRFGDSLVMWQSPLDSNVITCFVQEENEGRNWRISKEFLAMGEVFDFAVGMFPPSSSSGEMLTLVTLDIDGQVGVHFHSLKDENEEKEEVFVGTIDDISTKGNASLFCFAETNNLYLPLNDVLSGGSA